MKERNIAVSIILTLVTCGIYGLYWMVVITDDIKEQSGNNKIASGGVALLFTILTCGIYGIYWSYQMGKLLMEAKSRNGLTADDNSILFLVLDIFGLAIVNYALIQDGLNTIYSAKSVSTTAGPGVNA